MELKDALIENNMYDFYLEVSKKVSSKELETLFRIKTYKKGEMVSFNEEAGGKDGQVWKLLSGRGKQFFYPSSNGEYVFELTVGEWIGIPGAVSGLYNVTDIEFIEDTEVLIFPLGKIIKERPEMMVPVWEKISKLMVNKFIWAAEQVMDRTILSKEAYFLKMLADSNYNFIGITTKSLSERLGINLRTLQRIISSLEGKDIIKREKSTNKIWVEDYEKFDDYLDSLV